MGVVTHTQLAAGQMVGFKEALVFFVAIWLSAYATARGQETAGSDGHGEDATRFAIQKAEELQHAGEFAEAYRVLSSVPNGQSGSTGAALMNCAGSLLHGLGRLDEAEQHYFKQPEKPDDGSWAAQRSGTAPGTVARDA